MKLALLDAHSEYSILHAIPKVKKLVKTCLEAEYDAICLSDGPGIYGAIEFLQKVNEVEAQARIGLNINVLIDGTNPTNPIYIPLIGIARNNEGYIELVQLSSFALLRDIDPMLKMDIGHITKNEIESCKNIIWIVSQRSFENYGNISDQIRREFLFDLKSINNNEVYIGLDTRSPFFKDACNFADKSEIPIIACPTVLYLKDEHQLAHQVIRAIYNKCQVSDLEPELYPKSFLTKSQLIEAFSAIPQALENLNKVVENTSWNIPLNKWSFPYWEIPEGKTSDEVLREEVFAGAKKIFGELTDYQIQRLEFELDIIKTKGYSTYFLVVADLINWAKKNKIVTTTRGSAAGSFVSYSIGITSIDPLTYNLPFERFLNPFRPSLPDIDMDFADYRRHEVFNYAKEKYGDDHVAHIGTFGTMQARAVVRDVGRALGYSYGFCDSLAKTVPMGKQGFPMTLDRALDESPGFAEQYQNNPDAERLVEISKIIEGNTRHCSVHAAGVVIAPGPLLNYVPLQRDPEENQFITQYDMGSVESAGLVKMDFLGIRNLTIVEKALLLIKDRHGVDINIDKIPLDDPITFKKLANGETSGLLQLNGAGMTKYLKDLKPTTIDDIMAMVALYRPGPIESIPEYIKRKHGLAPIVPPHPLLMEHLEKSYGLLVYQDDVLMTAINLAGYDWGEADKFRKAMGKKIPEEMAKQKIKFYEGCKKHHNLTEEEIDYMWKLIEPFAAYGFNKAHACSYGMVAYQTAYLKANYPEEYMVAVLNSEIGNLEKTAETISECKRLGIKILPACVNKSDILFKLETEPGNKEPAIRIGLLTIKNVGEQVVEDIVTFRNKIGRYGNLSEFLLTIDTKDINKKSMESLVKAGTMSTIDTDWGSPMYLLENLEYILQWRKEQVDKKRQGLQELFSEIETPTLTLPVPKIYKNEMSERANWEQELFGFNVSANPLAEFTETMPARRKTIKEVMSLGNDQTALIAVKVISTKQLRTKKNNDLMMAAKVIDESGEGEVVLFPKTYEEQGRIWQKSLDSNNAVLSEVKLSERNGDISLIVQKTKLMVSGQNNEENIINSEKVILKINQAMTLEQFDILKKILKGHPGNHSVVLEFTAQRRIINTQEKIRVSPELKQLLRQHFGNNIIIE